MSDAFDNMLDEDTVVCGAWNGHYRVVIKNIYPNDYHVVPEWRWANEIHEEMGVIFSNIDDALKSFKKKIRLLDNQRYIDRSVK